MRSWPVKFRGVLSGAAEREDTSPADLPDGAMYAVDARAFLKQDGKARAWSFDGYGPARSLHLQGQRLTPRITCEALRAGYRPVLHATATA